MANALIRRSLLAIGLSMALPLPGVSADFAPGNHVIPGSKAADLEHCVRETSFMRRNHMELIEHQRHVTVHEGIRATDDGLSGCVACHVSYDQGGQPVPIYSEGQFCKTCHEFAAVELTCFGCHATVPAHTDAEALEEVAPQTGKQPEGVDARVSAAAAAGMEVARVPHELRKEVAD